MAANDEALRNALRVSIELPQIQQAMNAGVTNLGNVTELRDRLTTLLNVTLERPGDQSDRISSIFAALQQLDELELILLQLVNDPDAPSPDHASALDAADSHDLQDLAFYAPTPQQEPELAAAPQEVRPVPEDMGPLDCPICFTDEVPVEEQRMLAGCTHRYCVDCFRHHFTALIDEGKVSREDLRCPQPGCEECAEVYELHALLTQVTFEKFLQFMVLNQLKNDSNARWCINKECGQPIIWDPNTPHVECPACHTHFCFLCKSPWHEGPCAVVLTKEDEQFVRYVKAQGKATKPCPQCGTAIEKNEGCNHMTCPNCNHQWCWLVCFFFID